MGAATLLGIHSAHHQGAIRNGLHAHSAFCHRVPALHEVVQAAQQIQDSIVFCILPRFTSLGDQHLSIKHVRQGSPGMPAAQSTLGII